MKNEKITMEWKGDSKSIQPLLSRLETADQPGKNVVPSRLFFVQKFSFTVDLKHAERIQKYNTREAIQPVIILFWCVDYRS